MRFFREVREKSEEKAPDSWWLSSAICLYVFLQRQFGLN